ELDGLCAAARVPHSWIAAAQFDSLIGSDVRHVRGDTIAIVFVELAVALCVYALDVLRVFQKDGGHVLRRKGARAAILRRLHRIERGLRAAARFAGAREISGFEEVTVKLWRV